LWIKLLRFVSLLFTALGLVPAMTHLLEFPKKIILSAEHYLIVQQIYRGWALLGIVVVLALLSILTLTILVHQEKKIFLLTLTALLCIVGTQVIFWLFTYPVNQQTSNWTLFACKLDRATEAMGIFPCSSRGIASCINHIDTVCFEKKEWWTLITKPTCLANKFSPSFELRTMA
jgi:hypothetical protein